MGGALLAAPHCQLHLHGHRQTCKWSTKVRCVECSHMGGREVPPSDVEEGLVKPMRSRLDWCFVVAEGVLVPGIEDGHLACPTVCG